METLTTGFTRRRFLASVAGGGVVALAPSGAAVLADLIETGVRVGVHAGADGDILRLKSRRDGSMQVINVGPNTVITRGGRATIADFSVGEEMIAFGQPKGGVFRADLVDRLYRAFNGTLYVADKTAITVEGSRLAVTKDSVFADSLEGDAPLTLSQAEGREAHVLAWKRPAINDLAVEFVYVS